MVLGWEQALGVALALGLGAVVAKAVPGRWGSRVGPWAREAAVVLALYAAWQEGSALVATHTRGGAAHGRAVWRVERWLHLPGERSLQQAVLRAPTLMRGLNYYYAVVHVQDVIVCLLWLFWRHRDRYRSDRNALAWLTLVTLVVQAVPVAPPRLLPATGVVDAGRVLGYAIYPRNGLADAAQLTAMPSVHVAWAAWVTWTVVRSSTSRWRWLVCAHLVVTVTSVIATGYHWWLDGIVAVIMLGGVAGAQALAGRAPPSVSTVAVAVADTDTVASVGSDPHATSRRRKRWGDEVHEPGGDGPAGLPDLSGHDGLRQ